MVSSPNLFSPVLGFYRTSPRPKGQYLCDLIPFLVAWTSICNPPSACRYAPYVPSIKIILAFVKYLFHIIVRMRIKNAVRESRGAHSRLDYPNMDERLGKLNVVVSQKTGEMSISTSLVPEMPEELKKLLTENK